MGFGQQQKARSNNQPFFRGELSEYEGKTRISLWPTDEFKLYMKELAKG